MNLQELVLDILDREKKDNKKRIKGIYCIEIEGPSYHAWIYVMKKGVREGDYYQGYYISKDWIETMEQYVAELQKNGDDGIHHIVAINDELEANIRWKVIPPRGENE